MADDRKKAPTPIWEKQEEASEKKNKRLSLAGAVRALAQPEWDCLAFNEREGQIVFISPPRCFVSHQSYPARLTDEDITSLVHDFDVHGFSVGFDAVAKAAARAATFRGYDPFKQYLDALEWDGIARIARWLIDSFGARPEDDDEARYVEAIGSKWLISVAARTYQPGCQVDHVLIAEGGQGARKSTAFRVLAVRGEYFSSDLPDISKKDALEHLQGPVIIELDELDVMRGKEASHYKSFITRRVDRFRPAYGRFTRNHPRRFVFCGTTNEQAYLGDPTGNRRFWCFRVRGRIDIEAIERDRDQLWAEAVAQYKDGAPWWFEDDDLEQIGKAQQAARFKPSPWLDEIEAYLENLKIKRRPIEVTLGEILDDLGVDVGKRTQRDVNEVVRCLQHLGWQRTQVRRDGKRPRVYVPPFEEK